MADFRNIIDFWFGGDPKCEEYKHQQQLWFKISHETDELIRDEFADLLRDAEDGKLDFWKSDLHAGLALVILFDQFSRNIYRGTEKMFANDQKAVCLSKELINHQPGFNDLSDAEKFFVYLSLLHSEDIETARTAVDAIQLLAENCPEKQKTNFFKYLSNSKIHYELLLKFGRYPHRNMLFGRESSEEELEFLRKSTHNFVKSVLPIKKPTTFILNDQHLNMV